MDRATESVLRRSVISGSIAGLGVMTTAALAGRKETGSWADPFNGTSHILWGDKAARMHGMQPQYTLPGLVLTHASAVFWAVMYEQFFGRKQGERSIASPVWQPLLGGVAIASLAYVVDYHLVPRRFTPGYEKHVSGRSLAAIFGALALGLAARDFFAAARRQ